MRKLLVYWFKMQAAKAAKKVLNPYFNKNEINEILANYWQQYKKLKLEVPAMPTIGGSTMVHLAAMSTAFYHELTSRNISEEKTTQFYYDIAWIVYQKMGKFSWWISDFGNKTNYNKLLKATNLFRSFPFNSPSYQWENVKTENNYIGFDCLKCPVAEYFQTKGLSKFCTNTWCALDFPLAKLWNAELERSGSIANGDKKCDFRWKVKFENENIEDKLK